MPSQVKKNSAPDQEGPQGALTARGAKARLVEGNRRFIAGVPGSKEPGAEKRKALLQHGQNPCAVIVGCSDSRVPPELIFDGDLGDLFVLRSAGNLVDAIALGSIEYAVEHLDVPLVVVLGHESCGALKAAVLAHKAALRLSSNMQAMVEKIRPAVEEALRKAKTGADRSYSLVELSVDENIRAVKEELISCSSLLAGRVRAGRVEVVGAKYYLESGEVVFWE